jgi:hypothetical protein
MNLFRSFCSSFSDDDFSTILQRMVGRLTQIVLSIFIISLIWLQHLYHVPVCTW